MNVINAQVGDAKAMTDAVAAIGELLRERQRVVEDDVSIQSQEDFLATFSQITQTFTILLGSITGISLMVGGIGIMNIMLVSITEGTHAIGIRKAVGARRKDILSQFLVESVMVSVLGGAIGIVLGWGIFKAIAALPMPGALGGGPALQTVVTPEPVLLALGVSAVVGIFLGTYSASQAAKLHPIQALRYE